jgi:glutamate synthase (NADPH/NADH) small chain
MGKPTGFLEHSRNKVKDRAPLERIKDFEEFTLRLDEQERKTREPAVWTAVYPFVTQTTVVLWTT